jgi:hypothetical protein
MVTRRAYSSDGLGENVPSSVPYTTHFPHSTFIGVGLFAGAFQVLCDLPRHVGVDGEFVGVDLVQQALRGNSMIRRTLLEIIITNQ